MGLGNGQAGEHQAGESGCCYTIHIATGVAANLIETLAEHPESAIRPEKA